jgi:MFS transporter, OPA family, sugar phosphate sensor protein UhpC
MFNTIEESMLRAIIGFFKTGQDRERIQDSDKIRRLFERKRWSVFLSVTFGYGFFYVARINFSVVKKPMLDEKVLSTTEMGIIGSAMLVMYAIGKLTNGFLSDRANIRRFMSTALLCSSLISLVLGFMSVFVGFLLLWALNGWFQSIGSAPSVVSLSQWFSRREIGTRYGVWSASHGIGTAITFLATATLVSTMADWRWGFWGPGIVCLVVALIMYRTMADRPETYGLPSAAEYKGDQASKEPEKKDVAKVQLEVFKNPAIWVLGIASALMYVGRYGINNWGVLYLQEVKGYSLVDAGTVLSAYTIATVAGAVASGFISDHLFKSDRNRPALLFGIIDVSALTALYLLPPGNPWLDSLCLFSFGFGLGVLLAYLGGLMAVDLSSKRAAGTAMGMIGCFSYIGAGIQDAVSGALLDAGKTVVEGKDVYSFNSVFYFWIGTAALSVLLSLAVWNAKRR